MLQIMKDVPANVIGIRALGEVTKDDYENTVVPALEKAAKQTGDINLLMIFETDLGNFTMGAWMQDAKESLKHFGKWNRIAIVSDQKIVEKIAPVLGLLSPAKSRGFSVDEIELAKTWVATTEDANDGK